MFRQSIAGPMGQQPAGETLATRLTHESVALPSLSDANTQPQHVREWGPFTLPTHLPEGDDGGAPAPVTWGTQ